MTDTITERVTVTELEEITGPDWACEAFHRDIGWHCPQPVAWRVETACPGCGNRATALLCREHAEYARRASTSMWCIQCGYPTKDIARWYPVLGGDMTRHEEMMGDPRYAEACRLWDMSGLDEGWQMPSDPHARENLRHATGLLAAGDRSAADFLTMVLERYLGGKYRDATRREIERLARSAARAGTGAILRGGTE